MKPDNYKKTLLLFISITLVLAFSFQGSRGLWEPDEGRYVRCASEMLKSGDWLTPRLNGNPHFSKPPLTYWVIASGLSLFGMNEWGVRIFYAIAFVVTALMVGYLGLRMWDKKTGLLSCLVYSTMVLPFTAANIITTDMFLTLFETAALLCFWLSLDAQPNGQRKKVLYASLMWFFLGLAFLTKGPPGLIPLAVIILYLMLTKNTRWLSPRELIIGILIFSAASLPWYIMVVYKYSGLLSYFINNEVIGRIFTGAHTRNSGLFGAFKIYPHTLLLGALPWSCFWFMQWWKKRPQVFALQWWRNLRNRENALFIVLWFGISLFILSVSRSRLPLYMLPLFVPLALATSRSLFLHSPATAFAACCFRGKAGVYMITLIVLLVCSRGIAAHYPVKRDSRMLWNNINKIIQNRSENNPRELVLVDLDYDGLAFYSGGGIENVTMDDDMSLSYSQTKKFAKKCAEVSSGSFDPVFLLSSKYLKKVTPEFDKKGIRYDIEQGPFDYKLVFCERDNSRNPVVRNSEIHQQGSAVTYTIDTSGH